MVESEPSAYDETISGQPASFMAQAIFAGASRSALTIALRHPRTLLQVVPQVQSQLRLKASESYTAPYNCAFLRYDSRAPIEPISLGEFVFLVGSKAHCHLFMKLRAQAIQQTRWHGGIRPPSPGGLEAGGEVIALGTRGGNWDWREQPLLRQEFHHLLLGLIVDNRKDRDPLWELIQRQVKEQRKHDPNWAYLRLAIMYANHKALLELLAHGWAATGPRWAIVFTPLDLAYLVSRSQKHALPFTRLEAKAPRTTSIVDNVYSFLKRSRRDGNAAYEYPRSDEKNFDKIIMSLQEHGAQASFASPRRQRFFVVLLTLAHAVVIPCALGLTLDTPEPKWKWLVVYIWSLSFLTHLLLYLAIFEVILIFRSGWACFIMPPFLSDIRTWYQSVWIYIWTLSLVMHGLFPWVIFHRKISNYLWLLYVYSMPFICICLSSIVATLWSLYSIIKRQIQIALS